MIYFYIATLEHSNRCGIVHCSSASATIYDDNTLCRYKDWTYEKIIAEGGPANWTFLQCEHFINLCQEVIPQPDFFERVS